MFSWIGSSTERSRLSSLHSTLAFSTLCCGFHRTPPHHRSLRWVQVDAPLEQPDSSRVVASLHFGQTPRLQVPVESTQQSPTCEGVGALSRFHLATKLYRLRRS